MYNISVNKLKGIKMEAYGTYSAILEIADRAAGGYEKDTDGCIESYADWIVMWYQSDDCPEPIKSNKYHRLLLREHPLTIKSEVVKRLRT